MQEHRMTIPEAYEILKQGPTAIIIRKDYRESLLGQGIARPDQLLRSGQAAAGERRGRGRVVSMPISGRPGERMLIRQYLRGGLLRFFNRDLYWQDRRPSRELLLTVQAAAAGIPTSQVLAAVCVPCTGPFWRGYLIVRELASCCDLPEYLQRLSTQDRAGFFQEKRRVIKQVAALVRLMHDRGFFHADLNMKNILIDTAAPERLYIIDWDKSYHRDLLSTGRRRVNVLRLCRSMIKLGRAGIPVGERDAALLLKTYGRSTKNLHKDLLRLRLTAGLRSVFWKMLSG